MTTKQLTSLRVKHKSLSTLVQNSMSDPKIEFRKIMPFFILGAKIQMYFTSEFFGQKVDFCFSVHNDLLARQLSVFLQFLMICQQMGFYKFLF